MKKILFVCTGNTCRSPMAEALFNSKAEELKIDAEAFSRGIFADGAPVSENAATVLSGIGICGFRHISETVSEADMKAADYIIGISSGHAAKLIANFPMYRDKIFAFPFDISDPFGGDTEVYRKALSEISDGIDIIIREVFPECR